MADIPLNMQRLADRSAIQDCLHRYARGIDRRNWDFLASAFHPGATLHQGDFKGTIEEMLANVAMRHAAIEQSAHLLTNILIEFDNENGAVVETYYRSALEDAGLRFSGLSPDGQLPEIVEIPDHPWFIGVQFHPELKSKPFDPHPLFASYIEAAVHHSRLV